MAQGRFPIVEARQELGFTPTRAVRANIDVRTGEGEVGAAVGRGLVAVGEQAIRQKQRQDAFEERLNAKNRDNLDTLSNRSADQQRKLRDADLEVMRGKKPPEEWQQETVKIVNQHNEIIAGFDFSPQAQAEQQVRMNGDLVVLPKTALADGSRVISIATIKTADEMLTDAHRLNLPDLPQRELNHAVTLKRNGIGAAGILVRKTAAKEAGSKLRVEDLVNTVHAAIELGAKTGDFTVALELATNDAIPETKQTSLRTAIKTAESAKIAELKNQETALINTATSTAIRDFYKGDQTVANLNKKHEAGLIKDSQFKFMMEGLQNPAPDQSNVFARNLVGRAITNFQAGGSTRQDVERIMLKEFPRLSISDRNKFMDKLETEVVAGRENSVREAKSRGSALISKRFGGAKTIEEMLNVFASATKEDKRIFEVEWRNRNLYEDAVDDWVAEQIEKGKELTPRDIRIRSNDFLIDYRKTKELDIDLAEAEVTRREELVRPLPPAPLAEAKTLEELAREGTVKPVSEMTRAEKQAQLKRIRELK